MAASTVSREWLEWVGDLAQGSASPGRDRDRFACWLDDQPATLVPRRFSIDECDALRSTADADDLICNPHCRLLMPGELPAEVLSREEWRHGFAFDGPTAWVHDEDRQQWRPFWLEDDLWERCASAQRDEVPARMFIAPERELLVQAGILVSRFERDASSKYWATATSEGRSYFRQNGYCRTDALLHPFHVGEMRRYYRRLIRRGEVTLGDYQSSRRYVAHNEPVARFFHLQLAATVGHFAGELVKPSYVYFASYQSGAELKRHSDREQCELSLTFCLDYSPEPENATPWPIHLDTGRGQVTVAQALGEALLYRGCALPHWRDRLPQGHTSTSIFFHYVPENFTGSLT